jgi:hypothetical protein
LAEIAGGISSKKWLFMGGYQRRLHGMSAFAPVSWLGEFSVVRYLLWPSHAIAQ